MSVDIAVGSPLGVALQNALQPKLAEYGWTTGGLDDSALSEYIILMLANGKTQEELAAELSTDLLDLGENNPDAQNFAHWLFQEFNSLQGQLMGGQQSGGLEAANANDVNQSADTASSIPSAVQDAEMGDAGDSSSGAIPTGPKAMRNGSGSGSGKRGDRRMLNQMNKAMDRTDESALHRVRGTSGTGRINSHPSREPPKGPRGQQVGRGIAAAMQNGRGMGAMNMRGGMPGMNGMGMNGMNGMNGMPMPQMNPGMNNPMLSPDNAMFMMQIAEGLAQQMVQQGMVPQPSAYVNPNFQGGNRNGSGRSLFERVDKSSKQQDKRQQNKFAKKENQDQTMADGGPVGENGEGGMDVDSARLDPSATMCKFNLTCTRPDCIFVHQSPAAPPGASVDMSDTCSFAAACMNKKCVGKHPSPAQRTDHKAETDCMFYPNCTNPNCTYRHPSVPPCRNGADCTVPNCKFAHSTVECKFDPCTNMYCRFKHREGQKKKFQDKVWTAPKNEDGENQHVSERKFVDENAEEELILPGRSNEEMEIKTEIKSES